MMSDSSCSPLQGRLRLPLFGDVYVHHTPTKNQGHDVMFQLAGRIVTDPCHEADLMIDEDERRVLGSQGFVDLV
jgi:hypothetical protein